MYSVSKSVSCGCQTEPPWTSDDQTPDKGVNPMYTCPDASVGTSESWIPVNHRHINIQTGFRFPDRKKTEPCRVDVEADERATARLQVIGVIVL